MKPKNVVFFITDGHRADALGCYGNPLLETPCIDAFAAEGTRFTRSFCSHTVCMPTRASIYTGRYPHIHGVWANGVELPRSEVTLPGALAEHGVATCAAGKIHFEPQQRHANQHIEARPDSVHPGQTVPLVDVPYYGFQEVHMTENFLGREYVDFLARECPGMLDRAYSRQAVPEAAHELTWTTTQAIDFIERQTAAGRPFFCHCSYHELVPPCHVPEEYAGHYDPADMPVPELREDDLARKPDWYRQCYEGYVARGRHPDEPELRRIMATYYDQARFLDTQFGRLVQALKRLGVWDDTIVLFTSDHGLSLNDHWQWRHGPFLFDEVIHVPMIWHVPGADSGGSVIDAMVEQVDIMPTVLDLCGIDPQPGVQGHSIAPLLRGDDGASGRESVLVQEREAPDLAARGLDPTSVDQVGVRTQDWKLIHYAGRPYGELYDLRNDPGEFVNLWADSGYGRQRTTMERLLLDRLADARDPLPVRTYDW
ncbi:MAG: sulfatase-like hydrolase/transferase [Lentisphaeria bacterium]|nr:sulfatase-like hydrolase/transferase [Lentisphaeria bacterium]